VEQVLKAGLFIYKVAAFVPRAQIVTLVVTLKNIKPRFA
jgi:hypothetical protein